MGLQRTTLCLTSGRAPRWIAGAIALTFIVPLFGCSNGSNQTYAGSPAPYNAPQQRSGGPLSNMSTGKKVAILAGAAALYYMYKKHQNSQGSGPQGQYYRSKNGRVYYRDAQGNPVWVTPPSEGIQVPQDEAGQYEQGARDAGIVYGGGGVSNGGGYNNGYRGAPAGPRGPRGF